MIRDHRAKGRVATGAAFAIAALVLVPSVPSTAPAGPASVSASEKVPVDRSYLKAGGSLYEEQCASCHQQNGKGVPATFPPLAGNPDLAHLALVVNTVHSGHSGKIRIQGRVFDQTMPAIGAGFTAREIAEVATYVRNSWGNQFGGASLDSVKSILHLSPGGSAAAAAQPVDGALLREGQSLYVLHCATCHQKSGKGVPATFPPLVDNSHLASVSLVVNTMHSGHFGKITVGGRTFDQTMPAIGAGFTAEQLAAVATYVRNSWGNEFGGVSAAEAKRALNSK